VPVPLAVKSPFPFCWLRVGLALGVLVLGGAGVERAWAAFPPLALQPISLTQIVSPTNICNAGDGTKRLFVCDQAGKIWVIQDEMLLPTPFLDLTSKRVSLTTSYDERGVLGMAFHPNYGRKDINNQPLPGFGKFYVFYSAPSPNAPGTTQAPVNCRSTISEFQVSANNANAADPNSERIVLAFDKPQNNHNGGQLMFGPDGYLYISIGDGGSQHDNDYGHTGGQTSFNTQSVTGNLGNGQDKTKIFGKILRIDPLGNNGPGGQYGIPANNPFVGAGGGVREEIFTFGMRNPWRFTFDDGPGGTNRMFEGDVGQDQVEEVNILTSGGNYGWRLKEGTFDHDSTAPNLNPPLLSPIGQYAHIGVTVGSPALPQIGCSVIGGYVYRGSAIPALVGKYVFGDYSHTIGGANGTMLGLEEVPPGSNNWVLSQLTMVGGNPLSTGIYAFGRDEAGEIYVATKVTRGPTQLNLGQPSGAIYRVVAAQTSSVISAVHDNSIYSDFPNNSNALGSLYSGNTAQSHPRRALLMFDVASNVPAGATITSASLVLHLNNSSSANVANVSLYTLGQSWGEGTSQGSGQGGAATTGDTTWNARFFDLVSPTLWSTAGGIFNASASATTSVGDTIGNYMWTSAQMATDVQGWLNTPANNFGWILLGDEVATNTVKVFDSHEAGGSLQPQLQVNYNPVAPPLTRRESWLRQYYPTPGTFVDDSADSDGDGIPNLMEYAFGYSPLAKNPPGSGFSSTMAPQAGGATTFNVTFRRDPRATDLTYLLQTSSDLINWTTIVQSIAGGAPTGTGFNSETDAPSEAPIKIVTGTETLPAGTNRFARLRVIRSY